jgi:hypothetical protein
MKIAYYMTHGLFVDGSRELYEQLDTAIKLMHPEGHRFCSTYVQGVCDVCGWADPHGQKFDCGHSAREHVLAYWHQASHMRGISPSSTASSSTAGVGDGEGFLAVVGAVLELVGEVIEALGDAFSD